MQGTQLPKGLTKGFQKTYQQVINNIARLAVGCGLILCVSCSPEAAPEPSLYALLAKSTLLEGNGAYDASKTFTAGTRAYCVGAQNGTFPNMGWHIEGEMGGLWAHPIKLLDGFRAALIDGADTVWLESAQHFALSPVGQVFTYEVAGRTVRRAQFIPDSAKAMVVQYTIEGAPAQLAFWPEADLRPTWLGARTGLEDGADSAYVLDEQTWAAVDAGQNWTVMVEGNEATKRGPTQYERGGCITSSGLQHTFYIAGGMQQEEALEQLRWTQDQWATLFEHKRLRYERAAQWSQLSVPGEARLDSVFLWLKYNALWLEMDLPELGYGFMAGMEDYPWFFGCDAAYSILGLNAVGRYELSKSMLRLLAQASQRENGNGRIIHEMSTNGAVFNKGNTNETPQFVTACYDTFLWSGDSAFLDEMYPQMVAAMEWLKAQDSNGNRIPEGYGMMEIHGMNGEMIDVAAYSAQAWRAMHEVYLHYGESEKARRALESATTLEQQINRDYWVEKHGVYADVRGTPEQAQQLIADAIERAKSLEKPWAVAELERTFSEATMDWIVANPPYCGELPGEPEARPQPLLPYSIHHNWIVNTPMEVGFAPRDRAVSALDRAHEFTNAYGLFVTGIDRDESAGNDSIVLAQRKKTFSYVGAVMTLPTGVVAVAENRYGRPDRALDYLHRMARSWGFAHPGTMYEVSPDFGMMCQAWNIYSFGYPVVRQFFGVRPNAAKRTLEIDAQPPSTWRTAQLTQVRIGEGANENTIDLFWRENENGTPVLEVVQRASPPWKVVRINE